MISMLVAKQVTKVFGPQPERAVSLLRQGHSREEVLSRTKCTVAVREVDIEVRRGELFVIMGLSGSGKSTLLRMFNRLIQPTSGEIYVDGREISIVGDHDLRALRNRKLSMVFQHFAIFPHRTVRDNVSFGLSLRNLSKGDLDARTNWALESVGLNGWEDVRPAELSGGMKQRVGLARALATDAEVLLMDEPFSALDPLIRREMQNLLLQLHRNLGRTIVFVTHDLNEAMRIGDRIVLMKDGRVVQSGTGAEILASPADDYVNDFVSDVDRTRVLKARDIMRVPETASLRDDLTVVLNQIEAENAKLLHVVDEEGRFIGTVFKGRIVRAMEVGSCRLDLSLVKTDGDVVEPDARLLDCLSLTYGGGPPLAVVDHERRLLGVVSPDAVLQALKPPLGNKH